MARPLVVVVLLLLLQPPTTPATTTGPPPLLGCAGDQEGTTTVLYTDLGPLYDSDLPATGATFTTTDTALAALVAKAAHSQAVTNRATFGPLSVMVEGGGYNAVWLETQPMAGAMYATRDVRIALHNQLVFMRTQRRDGRLPGVVHPNGNSNSNSNANSTGLSASFCLPGDAATCRCNCAPCCGSLLQGFYLGASAVDVAWFMLGSPSHTAFVQELYDVLQRFDSWLWTTRSRYACVCVHVWYVFPS